MSVNASQAKQPINEFSDYIVYVDESGDHGMQAVDAQYPVFVLALCVFHKRHYSASIAPAIQQFKFQHFGHDLAVLHEHEIRKKKGLFSVLQDKAKMHVFQTQLTDIVEVSNFVLICCVIDKEALHGKANTHTNPYHLALGFCLETLHGFLEEKHQENKLTHVVVECRGKKEDDELELEFRRICDGANRLGKPLSFDVKFAHKQINSAGLQLADLVARPVGLSVCRPKQDNRAFEVLKRKFYCSAGRQNAGTGYENWGLKIFPHSESEKPR